MKNQQDRYEPVGGHKEMVARWKRDPAFRQAYDDLADEISLFDTCLAARKRAGLSQSEVARRMGTSRPVVARIESPTWRSACSRHSTGSVGRNSKERDSVPISVSCRRSPIRVVRFSVELPTRVSSVRCMPSSGPTV